MRALLLFNSLNVVVKYHHLATSFASARSTESLGVVTFRGLRMVQYVGICFLHLLCVLVRKDVYNALDRSLGVALAYYSPK